MVACGYAHQYWETFGNDNKPLAKGYGSLAKLQTKIVTLLKYNDQW
jgi:hypothetical protein